MMMKKVNYLLIMLFAVALMSTSCCKDDPIPDPVEITVDDLVGDWDFVSLEFDGATYTDCAEVLTGSGYEYVKLSLFNVSTTELTLYDGCVNDSSVWDYALTNNILDIPAFNLEIQNVETFFDGNGEILKLKLLTPASYHLEGGVYTLEKR